MTTKNIIHRRGKRFAIWATAICSTWLMIVGIAQAETVRGVVFDDRNTNGSRDPSEPGIAGVRVSNGVDIVTTDHLGNYEIEIDNDAIIFVIKPRDWQTRADKLNIPRFYYIHKPAGSPDDGFKFPGVEPTGPLPESVDFALTASPDPDEFTVVLVGDPQPYSRQQVRFYGNDVIAELVDTKALFGMSMGDIVGDDLALFDAMNAVQGVVGIPWYNVHGNHDINYRSPNDKYSDETFERFYGPTNYAFQYGAVHFIVLDNVYWIGATEKEKGRYEGRFSKDQLQFVANYLERAPKEDRVVVCTHIPLPHMGHKGAPPSTHEYPQLLKILSSHPHTLSFSAHTHINDHRFAGSADGYIPTEETEHHHHNIVTGSGSWWRGIRDTRGIPLTPMADGAPNGYIIATFRGNEYHLRYKAAHMPDDYQIAIHTQEVVDVANSAAAKVVANVFNGNSKTKVKMRVRGFGDWMPMQHLPQTDPAYAAAHLRDVIAADGKRTALPAPKVSGHIWSAQLPADIPRGVYVLEVESTDMFGQVDRGIRLIDVDQVSSPPTTAVGKDKAVPAGIESQCLSNLRQVTSDFLKAGEGYFSPDGQTIVYQAVRKGYPFYQIYTQSLFDKNQPRRISAGRGRTTCAYFSPTNNRILFASSHLDPNLDETEAVARREAEEDRKSGRRRRYSWVFDPQMDLFEATPEGELIARLTNTKGYDAECAYSPDGKQIVFCSDRDGDPDLYIMNVDGTNIRQLTNEPGYDGGPFFSPDGLWIVYRTDRKRKEYLQIHAIRVDGTNDVALTNTEGVNWAPYWHPTKPYIIWTGADHSDPTKRPNYDLWMLRYKITNDHLQAEGDMVRITDHPKADVLPVFSPDGKQLLWTSNRTQNGTSQLWIADFQLPEE